MKEFIIDSNIILRLLTQDPISQFRRAEKIVQSMENKEIKVKLSILVVNEILWIMEKYYNAPRRDFVPKLQEFIGLENVSVLEISKPKLMGILQHYLDSRVDFTDNYIFSLSGQSKKKILSFDKDFDKLKKGVRAEEV